MTTKTTVYVLYHSRTDNHTDDLLDYEDVKCLGVFSSLMAIENAKQYARTQKGFQDYPNGFICMPYVLDEQDWREGFGD